MEVGGDRMHFLDVTVIKDNEVIEFWYHKPIFLGRYLNFWSQHPVSQKIGEINLLTLENKIDLENSICVTPTGYLILSLLTDDYQALGLEGKPSTFSHKFHTRYVVRIDLTNESFIPGKKNYERIRIALEERLTQKFDVIVSWDPPEISMCPSSIAAWFYARNYNVCRCCQKFFQKIKYSLTIPTYEDTCNNTDIDFFEWLGIFSIDGDLSTKGEDNCANTYQCPSPSIHVRQVQYLQWTGFFTRQKIQEVYNILKQYILSRNTLPWISLDIQGFADSAISFDLKEHMFLTDGDNSYTIVFHPKSIHGFSKEQFPYDHRSMVNGGSDSDE
ncbi:PREDICTED: ribonuclease P protein subunit p40-like [Atta colombica]|uniref:ribonuclease P protein subunit p40-like n=1 Tax=Atta colombica TaxID=520822 RepID=UPI00084C9662|nr:PREDICTED: ribonuclease P protein subunit p40-like [Atta colombica]